MRLLLFGKIKDFPDFFFCPSLRVCLSMPVGQFMRAMHAIHETIGFNSCVYTQFMPQAIHCAEASHQRYSMLCKNCLVLGFCGLVKISSGVESSAIFPSYINTTLSATSRAKPIS